MKRPGHHGIGRWLAWGLAAVVLAAVFAAYLRPEMMVDLGSRLYACF